MTNLASLSISDIQREIRRRERSVRKLYRKRNRLARQLAALDAQIAASGGNMGRSGGRGGGSRRGAATRSHNKASLADALAAVLKGKRMSVGDAAAAVRRAGYRSSSANFRTMVNIQLVNKKRFTRVGRGVYTA